MNQEVSIWDKIDLPAPEVEEDGGETQDEEAEKPPNKLVATFSDPKWKWKRRALDFVGAVGWTYAFLKVFIFDIERDLIGELAPSAEWLADLRFFIVFGLMALAVIILRPRSLVVAGIYIVFFPLVVLLWKLPRFLINSKSWVAAFAAVNMVTALFSNLRYILVSSALALFAALAIVESTQTWLLTVSAFALGALLLISLGRTVLFSFKTSRFMTAQERGIAELLDSKPLTELIALDDDLRSTDIEKFDSAQEARFLMSVASSVAVNRALYFWGYQLDQYRKSPATILYNSLAYVWALTQSVIALTLINLAIYKNDHAAFTFDDPPGLLVFARYSFSSLIGNEINALQAHSDWANGVSLASMFIGIALLGGLILTLALSFRRERQNAAIHDTLGRIDVIGRELEVRHRESFELTIQATLAKLDELQYALRGVGTYFASRIPPGWRPGD